VQVPEVSGKKTRSFDPNTSLFPLHQGGGIQGGSYFPNPLEQEAQLFPHRVEQASLLSIEEQPKGTHNESPHFWCDLIRHPLMTQSAIQVVIIPEATLHRIVEGLTIKSSRFGDLRHEPECVWCPLFLLERHTKKIGTEPLPSLCYSIILE